ncbi:hypothetical protein BAUCODRAFT_121246 [Baudoinia panamericana UAMH 10762]|uniref:RRM domain-containing protein n=1 Tax=Baudoinia panamericana (strain UAMH 10762) TaxID=717646 RepID=M2NGD9_BAUPA|nr:uncharacterized protein BAUCODRAFT_121246 [Baudoinia panamericana UAMH 10762]EMC98374.1 hypothetical protein BAUCODRAFT_121246 [Baudoinia panamericana UAMH 10762]
MSREEPNSRKEKKALRDAERHRNGRKRKHAETGEPAEVNDEKPELEGDVLVAVPQKDGNAVATQDTATSTAVTSKKRKQSDREVTGDATRAEAEVTSEQPAPKRKKRRKAKRDPAEVAEGTEAVEQPHKSRFILFVGNLPFNTTDATLQAYFKKLAPFNLRHRTDPQTKKSKGFAFLEFENYDRMETCLKLYHHGMFDPEDYVAGIGKSQAKGKKKSGRRINVELTAGGGGKAGARMEKIKAKNVKLEEERKRRLEMEKDERGRQPQTPKGAYVRFDDKDGEAQEQLVETDGAGMHPSRLARMKG